jgi:SnoaL-like domain
MNNVTELIDRYIATWNETDVKRRRDLIAKTWTEDGSYVDAHRSGTGNENISTMIQGVQEQLPGYRLRLASAVDAHNDRVRFQWEAGGTAEAPLHSVGTDFGFIADDGRFKSIAGFLDEAPGLPAKQSGSRTRNLEI